MAAGYVPRLQDVSIDWRVLAFVATVSIAAGIGFALAPALAASRPDVQHDLRDGARGTIGRSRRLRGAFVVIEVAAAMVLVIGAGLVLKSFWRLVSVSPGFTVAGVLTADVGLPSRYETDPPIIQFYDQLLSRVRAIPGVTGAGVVNNLPVSGRGWTAWITIEHAPPLTGEPPEVGYRTASSGYFAAMQIPILEGRGIADSDTATSERVVIVNKALADRFFANGRAIGSRVRLGPSPKAPWWTIVGVAGNVRHTGPETEPAPEAFLPLPQEVNGDMTLAVRTSGDPAAIAGAVRDVSRGIDPAVTIWRMRTITDLLDEHLAPRRLAMWLIAGFGGVALALALLGIYGVMQARARALGAAAANSASSVPADAAERLRALGYVSGSSQPVSNDAPNPADHIAAWNTFERELTRLDNGEVRAALTNLAALARRYPDAPVFQATYARALKDTGRAAQAVDLYRRLVARWPKDASLYHDLAVAAGAAGMMANAQIAIIATMILFIPSSLPFNWAAIRTNRGDELQKQGVNH